MSDEPSRGKGTGRIKRRDLGLAGGLVALSQIFSSLQNSHTISGEMDKLKHELVEQRVLTEQYFVRKVELKEFAKKVDRLTNQIAVLNIEVKSLKITIKQTNLTEFRSILGQRL